MKNLAAAAFSATILSTAVPAMATTFSVTFSEFDLKAIFTYEVTPSDFTMVLRTDAKTFDGNFDIIGFVSGPSIYPSVQDAELGEVRLDSFVGSSFRIVGGELLSSGINFQFDLEDFYQYTNRSLSLEFSGSQIGDINSLLPGDSREYPIVAWYYGYELDIDDYYSGDYDRIDVSTSARGTAKAAVTVISNPSTAAIPLPAAGWMLVSAITALGFSKRRRLTS